MYKEDKLRSIGLSNFNIQEYAELVESGIEVVPAINQIEVSPVMYRKELIDYFQSKNILVCAYKPLNRAGAFDRPALVDLASNYGVTPPQIMIRWGMQKGLIVAAKSSRASRMAENRNLANFELTEKDMSLLDYLTTTEDLRVRQEHELKRKTEL